jgi:hypothetical protein
MSRKTGYLGREGASGAIGYAQVVRPLLAGFVFGARQAAGEGGDDLRVAFRRNT